MKRFHAREMAILLGPVALIGVVGFWASRRKPQDDRLRLSFSVEKPTTLEAFDGGNVTLIAELAGKDASKFNFFTINPFLELHTQAGIQRGSYASGTGKWGDIWKKNTNSSHFLVDLESIPPGELFFGCDVIIGTWTTGVAIPSSPRRSGKWKINRETIKPFEFEALPRKPLLRLKSVTITSITSNRLGAQTEFFLQGANVDEKTTLENSFHERQNRMGGYGGVFNAKETARRRVREWEIDFSGFPKGQRKLPIVVTGRASAGNRWPLAFQIEPFDFNKVKVGQKLKFKSWPASLPSSTKAQ